MVQQQLEQLSVIGRCEYQKTCALLVQLFDQSATIYQELLSSQNAHQMYVSIKQGKFNIIILFIKKHHDMTEHSIILIFLFFVIQQIHLYE